MIHIPIFRSEEESIKIYVLCGRIALYWGPVELGIEGLLIRLRNKLKYGITPNSFQWSIPFPIPLSRKIQEIERHLKSSPKFADIERDILPLLSRCKWIHDIRTHIVHSICQGTDLEGKVIFGRSNQKKGIAYTDKKFSPAELEKVAVEMLHLVPKLNDLFNRLGDLSLR